MNRRIDELAPCGVYCGACPSFGKSCEGCSAENPEQKRISKWKCKLRICCYEESELDYCFDCRDFPCTMHNKKLGNAHPKDIRYTYRHEIPSLLSHFQRGSVNDFLTFQRKRWKCKSCGEQVYMYTYECCSCGKKQMVGI